jgi:ribosomal protein S18 acetylase RimI-like enzyme
VTSRIGAVTATSQSTEHLRSVDWRDLPHDQIDHLYAAEIERWNTALEWDTATSWAEVESGRRLGTARGVVLVDDRGDFAGWSFYTINDRALQIGAFIAPSLTAAQAMLDTIFGDRNMSLVDRVTFFSFSSLPGLGPALRSRGLSVDRYRYLARRTHHLVVRRPDGVRRWRSDDARATAELLGRAYADADEARPFAPGGTSAEWSDYVEQLTDSRGCGVPLPDASFCVSDGQQLLGVALVTRVAESTCHLAQLVIDPRAQGRHLGRRLLDLVCASAAQAGCRLVTLFVAERNNRARRLYETSAFEATASFLSAGAFTRPKSRSTVITPIMTCR